MAASTTKLLLNTNAKNLKAILFPTKVNTLGNNIFTNGKITEQLKQINSANKKVLKSKVTKEALIKEIKDLYAKLDLSSASGGIFLTPAGPFGKLPVIAPGGFIGPLLPVAPFEPFYTSIRAKVDGQRNTNLNPNQLRNITNIKAKISGLSGQKIPAGAGAIGIKKLYQLYLIVYYLNKLVNMDNKKIEQDSLYLYYQAAQKSIDEFVKGKNATDYIKEMENIIDAFITNLNTNITMTSISSTKLENYKKKFLENITNEQISFLLSSTTGSTNQSLQSTIKLILFNYTNQTITNIYDYMFNYINGRPNKSTPGIVSSSGVMQREVIKNVKNTNSRKVLLQLIKVLGIIMPEFKRKEFLNKLKSIKNSTPSVINNLNSSLKRFLSN